MPERHRALVLKAPGQPVVQALKPDAGSSAELMVDISYSSINYKDALAVTGAVGIIRGEYPFVPGIDLVGRVRDSSVDTFGPGDQIILTGGGLGESFWGGYSQMQAIRSNYATLLPAGMSPRTSMILGTAGLTAMLSVMALEAHGTGQGDVVVTGASGGVGMIAVHLLSKLGYNVLASCRSQHLSHKLIAIGAHAVVDRLTVEGDRPLYSGRWDGAIDAAGGPALSALLPQIRRHGCVAASGNAAGATLNTSVYPFILRGVKLIGIDSNTATCQDRSVAWARLSELMSTEAAESVLMATVTLEEIASVCRAKVAGQAPGRFLVDVNQ